MAIESNPLILHTEQGVPSKKAFLVAIPMDMFRVKIQDFKGGLDFFQHSILRFKVRPDITNKEIAQCTGLDERLIENVNASLKALNLLSENGYITDDGKLALRDPHKLIKSEKKSNRIGYVFKLPANDLLLNTYIDEISPANVKNLSGEPMQLVEESTDGRVSFRPLLVIDASKSQKVHLPKESEILHLLELSYCHEKVEDESLIDTTNQELSIQYVPDDKPTSVLVCTYVYLPILNKDVYASDWAVLDPFNSNLNSPQLKFYLESLNDSFFQAALSESFSAAPTVMKLSFGQLQEELAEQVKIEIETLWGSAFEKLDANLQTYVKIVMQKKREMGYCHFSSRDFSQSFVSHIQAALETILKIDRRLRAGIYNCNRADFDEKRTKSRLSRTLRGDLVVDTETFNSIWWYLKKVVTQNINPYSLNLFLPEFILSCENQKNNPLFLVIVGYFDLICKLANIRNDHDHGKTENEGLLESITREESDKYYHLLIDLINSQIN